MKKTILVLTALSLAAAFTACRSNGEQTTEERLRSIYGWKGEALPAPAPNPAPTEVSITEKATVEEISTGKDAGIVSTVDVTETITTDIAKADEKKTDKAGDAGKSAPQPVKKDDASVKAPSIQKNESEKKECELSGETKTYIVKQGESLWTIAAKEYQSGYKWVLIYRANKELLKGKPDSIHPGMKLVIPLLKTKNAAAPAKVPAAQTESVPTVKPAPQPLPAAQTPAAAPAKVPAAQTESVPAVKPAPLPAVPAPPAEPAKKTVPANGSTEAKAPSAK